MRESYFSSRNMTAQNELLYQIALTLLPGVGDTTAKKLVAYCGGVEAIFKQKKQHLMAIPDIGPKTAELIASQDVLPRAEEELAFIEKNEILPIFYLEANYPKRMRECEDGPVLLYTKGNTNFNNPRVLSIVGTRKITDYGTKITERIVEALAPTGCLIVSGLAYGVDITAHKAAIQHGLQTIGIVAHGLDILYPSVHRKYAKKMLDNGGIATDFMSGAQPDKMFFPRRNRIIAGLADATLVIEAAEKSGTLITAELAIGYNRDVMAVPGKVDDEFSIGCNKLIQQNKAALVTSGEDIINILNWQPEEGTKKVIQPKLFVDLTAEEQALVDVLKGSKTMPIDEIGFKAGLPPSKCSSLLFTLEFKGVVKALPGKIYELA